MLAESYLQHERTDEGLAAIAEAKELVARADEHIWEAELNRIDGELQRLQGASPDKLEFLFQKALAIARIQSAKSFELRASMSLARFWRDQQRSAEARDLLAPIYNWFTEGFDTADLKEAKDLLDALTS